MTSHLDRGVGGGGLEAASRRDRPIIFSAPMVKALLAGRKTQTRRALTAGTATVNGYPYRAKEPAWAGLRLNEATARAKSPWTGLPDPHLNVPWEHPEDAARGDNSETVYRVRPRTEAGDRLWCKEEARRSPDAWTYAADDAPVAWPGRRDLADRKRDICTSLFLPRSCSRLTLIVETVKVERLQDISEEDAIAEGVRRIDEGFPGISLSEGPNFWTVDLPVPGIDFSVNSPTAAGCYRMLWEHIHGEGAWDANPWVAALTFRAISKNIDTLGGTP